MNKKVRVFIFVLLVVALLLLLSSLVGKDTTENIAGDGATAELSLETSVESVSAASIEAASGEGYAAEASTEMSAYTETYSVEASTEESVAAEIDEYGIYDSKEEVALYIVTYDKLPQNYITKKEAKKLGWSGGSLEEYAPGKCIGGDYFGNYEGNLPVDSEYHECDIDTLGKKSRGAKRLVFSDDGYIYYTEDHYETFELIYEPTE